MLYEMSYVLDNDGGIRLFEDIVEIRTSDDESHIKYVMGHHYFLAPGHWEKVAININRVDESRPIIKGKDYYPVDYFVARKVSSTAYYAVNGFADVVEWVDGITAHYIDMGDFDIGPYKIVRADKRPCIIEI